MIILTDDLWRSFSIKKRDLYINRLKTLGSLSGLFKDLDGGNGHKPFLNYRNHEITYIKSFDVHGITRKDSAFDAIAQINNINVGIGLKTWIHNNDISYQKVAEFNKDSALLRKLFEQSDFKGLVYKLAELRNLRIDQDIRLYNTNRQIYHIITRDDDCMYVVEEAYDRIRMETLDITETNDKSVSFSDGVNKYRFMMSKSTLYKKFDASKSKRIARFDIEIEQDPFLVLDSLFDKKLQMFNDKQTSPSLTNGTTLHSSLDSPFILLPLYADSDYQVPEASRFNASLAAPKVKGSNKPRPAYEAYLQIDKFIHLLFPRFFGIDVTSDHQATLQKKFTLHLPTGESYPAKLTQDNAKSLQTNPQSALGRWLLYNIFGLKPYEKLTRQILDERTIDCVRVTKVDDSNFSVDVANYLEYEQWKLHLKPRIEELIQIRKLGGKGCPVFRPNLFEQG